jgi:hypothetical protein
LIALYPASSAASAVESHLADLQSQPKLEGLTRYNVLEQGGAPNSTVPHMPITVSSMAQAWFSSTADLQTVVTKQNTADAALYTIKEYKLL